MKAKQQAALAAVVLAVVFMCAFGFLVLFARPASPALRSAGTQPEVEQAEDAQEDPQLIQTVRCARPCPAPARAHALVGLRTQSAIRQVVAQELAPVMKLLDKQKEDILASVQTAKDSSAASIMAVRAPRTTGRHIPERTRWRCAGAGRIAAGVYAPPSTGTKGWCLHFLLARSCGLHPHPLPGARSIT